MNNIQYLQRIILVAVFFTTSFIVSGKNKVYSEPVIPGALASYSEDDLIFIQEDGKKIALSDLKGKIVFINFWATWCGPCVEEMPSIQKLKSKFKNDEIVFIMLNIESNLSKAKKFMKKRNLDLPVHIAGSPVSSSLFKNVVPTTLIYNKEGKLEANIQGMRDFGDEEIYHALKELSEK
ncbi:MAG: TlpA family protein disulfide reductase [Chryseobacterium sp.]|jgi:thiol-disulfide isomerase/thioredoxin|uniref:TlpA family protein disulfide reductase n=1 Tax=Chryseobacterium sp. TaxID=1871047 RepID=UPI00282D7BF2|nr:TlpA disulfide reductase family protein [Chryseobacterium sp.]MDR2235049.1 TlpA family protein disulfide reductase [Chryseobacterium sp.]